MMAVKFNELGGGGAGHWQIQINVSGISRGGEGKSWQKGGYTKKEGLRDGPVTQYLWLWGGDLLQSKSSEGRKGIKTHLPQNRKKKNGGGKGLVYKTSEESRRIEGVKSVKGETNRKNRKFRTGSLTPKR